MSWPSEKNNKPRGGIHAGGGCIVPATTNSISTGQDTVVFPFAQSAWGPFNAVEFLYANHTATPITVNNACAGVAASGWENGVFNIAKPLSGWTNPTGAVIVPAGSGIDTNDYSKMPGYNKSPKMRVRSVPRTPGDPDGGLYELVLGRVCHLQGNNKSTYTTLGGGFYSNYDPGNGGISLLIGDPVYGYDIVTDPTAMDTSIRAEVAAIAIAGVIFTYDQKMVCIGGPGDSVYTGLSTAGQTWAFSHLFKAVSRIRAEGKMVSYFNNGISGSTMEQIVTRGKSIIGMNILDIVVLHSNTSNGATTTLRNASQEDWDTQWYMLMDLVEFILASRETNQVVLMTPLPDNSFTPAQNQSRLKHRNRVLNSGFPVIDVESLADAAGHWKNPAHTSDGNHASPEGQEEISWYTQNTLSSLV